MVLKPNYEQLGYKERKEHCSCLGILFNFLLPYIQKLINMLCNSVFVESVIMTND